MVTINGTNIDAAGMQLRQYLEHQGLHAGCIAIELNGHIVPRSTYDTVTLTDGDSVEIVHFVGGG